MTHHQHAPSAAARALLLNEPERRDTPAYIRKHGHSRLQVRYGRDLLMCGGLLFPGQQCDGWCSEERDGREVFGCGFIFSRLADTRDSVNVRLCLIAIAALNRDGDIRQQLYVGIDTPAAAKARAKELLDQEYPEGASWPTRDFSVACHEVPRLRARRAFVISTSQSWKAGDYVLATNSQDGCLMNYWLCGFSIVSKNRSGLLRVEAVFGGSHTEMAGALIMKTLRERRFRDDEWLEWDASGIFFPYRTETR